MTFAREMQRIYSQKWETLNARLSDVVAHAGLGAALRQLCDHQRACGVSDGSPVERFAVEPFLAVVRPARAARHLGAGLASAPEGFLCVHEGCFLCNANIEWKSGGNQIGLDLSVGGRRYVALAQTFPIESRHVTVALREHLPHALLRTDDEIRGALGDLVELAVRARGWLFFLNGRDAGASLRHHHHGQAVDRPSDAFTYPLERAADAALANHACDEGTVRTATIAPPAYPLTVLVADGAAASVIARLVGWAAAWRDFNRADSCCGNWIVTADRDTVDRVRGYFVLRSPFFLRAPGLSGAIASLETLGVAVISSDEGRERLERGQFDGQFVYNVLHAVNPPQADTFAGSLPPLPEPPQVELRSDEPLPATPADLVALIAIGGYGTRAGQTPKALQAIYDKPVFYYLVSQAIAAGARRVVIAAGAEVRPFVERALARGESLGVELEVVEVSDPRGPADLFRRPEIAARIRGRRVLTLLDGIYLGATWRATLRRLVARRAGCVLLGRRVEDPRPFGYLHLDDRGRVTELSEKRTDITPCAGVFHPVVTHISVFDATAVERALLLTPADSGEYQLPDLQGAYAAAGECEVLFEDAGVWADAGTPELVLRLSNLVASLQDGGLPVGSPHWEAYEQGFVTETQMREYAGGLPERSPYRALLLAAL